MTEYQRYISQRVFTDQQPVTYKLVSRHFGLHVNDAKKVLYTFVTNNKDTCIATYIITGLVNNKKQIRFTTNLPSKDQFDSVTSIQVYSVKSSKSVLSLNDVITSVNDDLSNYPVSPESCAKWGIIKCPDLVIQKEQVATARKHDIKKEESRVVKKQAIESNSSTKKDPFASYKSRKLQLLQLQETPAPVKEQSAKPKYQYVSRKLSKPEVKPKPSVKKVDSDLQALFDDDDDDFKDETFEEDKKEATPVEIESIEDELADPIEDEVIESVPEEPKPIETEVETDTQDKLEEPEIDEDGYIVTKKKKPITKPSKKSAPQQKAISTTLKPLLSNKQKKQTSLMSFFGKR